MKNIMVESIEYLLGDNREVSPCGLLVDFKYGPGYTARDTIAFVQMIGFEVCTTSISLTAWQNIL
jgi:hypothetical protein